MKLFKGMSAGTTALIHPGPPPAQEEMAAALEPVRGVGADLFVAIEDHPRVFTADGEISPPSAAVRLTAAYLHGQTPSRTSWDFFIDGMEVHVRLDGEEYLINHGPWSLAGGEQARSEGHDTVLHLAGLADPRPALRIRLGGRTIAVSALASAAELGEVDFHTAPRAEPAADLVAATTIMGEREVDLTGEGGTVIGTERIGAVQVRGYDLQAGEMFSADALAIAAGAAARTWLGEGSAGEWVAVFGGGNTRVVLGEHALAAAEARLFAEISWWG